MSVWCARGFAALTVSGVLSGEVMASSEAGEFGGCDWTIVSETGDRSSESREEVEDRLLREFAIKLKQFDECAEQLGSSQAKAASGGAAGGDGADSGGGQGQDQAAQGGESEPGDSTASIEDARRRETDGAKTTDAADQTAAMRLPSQRTAQGSGKAREPIRRHSAEDDVARIIREAAQKETDPKRRAALWEEYENYVKNL